MPTGQEPDRVLVQIDTADGRIEVGSGDDPDGISAAAVKHLADLVNGRAQPAGTAVYESSGNPAGDGRGPAATLTVPVPGGPVTVSAGHVSDRVRGGDPLGVLARALRADGAPAGEKLADMAGICGPGTPAAVARIFGVGTNVAERARALTHTPAPWRLAGPPETTRNRRGAPRSGASDPSSTHKHRGA